MLHNLRRGAVSTVGGKGEQNGDAAGALSSRSVKLCLLGKKLEGIGGNKQCSGQGRLVTLSGPEQVLHFWEVEESRIERVKTTVLDCIPSSITALTVDVSRNVLFLGSSAGTVHQLHLWSFILDKEVISEEQLLANVPEEHQENPGEVVQVAMNPFLDDQVMVAFSQGFMMLWSTDSRSCLNILKSSQKLQGVCWRSEDEFFSAHDDGSFTVWDSENGAQIQAAHTPYGPYPCRAIRQLYCKEAGDIRWCIFR